MEKRKIKHIYWFAHYNLDSPSVRYRAKFPLDFAKENLSISSRLIIPGYAIGRLWNFILGYFSAMFCPKKNSLIVIQKVRSNFIYSNLLKLLILVRKEISVYDIDDAEYLEYNPRTINFFARNCNHISAGSTEIANYIKQFNNNVFHITSPTPDFGIIKKERNTLFTIGWVGGFGGGHKASLFKYLFPALKELFFDCQLTIIGITKESDVQELRNYFKNSRNIKISVPNNIDWQNEHGIQNMIKQFDVGIATLLKHPIQLAKSGIKAKQYLNNGVPVICNNLPENNKVVVDSFNGFICDSSSEFSKRLIEFKYMKDEHYWEFSQNARHSIENFNHWKYFEEFEKMKNST